MSDVTSIDSVPAGAPLRALLPSASSAPCSGDAGRLSSHPIAPAGRPAPWEYRFRNARFTLLEQVARKFGVELPRLAAYNRAPHKTLKLIASDCDLRPDWVRRCLAAVLDGAPVSRKGAICTLLASGATGWGRAQGRLRAERLVKDRDFRGLCREINHARAVIVHKWPRAPDGQLINDAGAAIDQEASKARKVNHLLDGAETMTLRAVSVELGEEIETSPCGWDVPARLDARWLAKRIQQRTGYRMSIAVKRR